MHRTTLPNAFVHPRVFVQVLVPALVSVLVLPSLVGCGHYQTATVLPRGAGQYDLIGQSSNEEQAYRNAEAEGRYVCEEQQGQMVVKEQKSEYQGADKNAKGDVEAENVALAFITGRSGKERNADDYKVTLSIVCE